MAQNLDVIDTTVQKTHTWINEVAQEAGMEDTHQAYLALRAVLHTIRDRLTIDEAADLSAQVPMLVRGIYFEGWHPADNPTKIRRAEEFLDAVSEAYPDRGDHPDPRVMVKAVFRVIGRNIDGGEVRHVIEALPKDVQELVAA